ncbi:hypothetical protein EJB05_54809, partial [Eragrostis curvula]
MSTSRTLPTARCAVRMINSAATVSGRSSRAASGNVVGQGGFLSRKDYYNVLSLEHSAAVGAEEIKRAYRRLALRYHPDLCPPARRVELRHAYETLSSSPTRRGGCGTTPS